MQPKRRHLKAGAEEALQAANQGQPRREMGANRPAMNGPQHLPPPPPSSHSLAFQQQQQQQAMAANKQQSQLGNKDLIIRMLAEIFQVRQDETGQMRWLQVSTSLVPISLYSRTTSKWLDYLLTAPLSIQANDPANTMSPDSRDFLLLLQQFHQQTTSRPGGSGQQQLGRNGATLLGLGQRSEPIVFQVVGHDFIDGQCRKILNVKVRQPGTRLGRASDYFVYWKEQPDPHHILQHQQFSASSYASNASFMQQQSSSSKLPHQATAQMLNPFQAQHPVQSQSTWGLNFASMNDAKLFYDICSLNIVNLDFNSEYLKQLSLGDNYRLSSAGNRLKQSLTSGCGAAVSPCSLMLNQRGQQRPRNADLQSQRQRGSVRNRAALRMLNQENVPPQHLDGSRRVSPERQSSISRCPSCKQALLVNGCPRQATLAGRGGDAQLADQSCPVHGRSATIRARSRSTTRRAPSGRADLENSARARSFSTPASPDPDRCPVHRRRLRTNADCELEARDLRQTLEQMKRHARSQQQPGAKLARKDTGPEKPARGLLRSSYLIDSTGGFGDQQQIRRQHPQQGAPLAQRDAPTDRPPARKTRYLGYLHNASQEPAQNQFQKGEQADEPRPTNNRSLFRRTQTGTETFDAVAHRNAQLARAQYAKSRNMKEFLSLDAGGLKSAASLQIGDLHQQQQHRRQNRQAGPATNTGCAEAGRPADPFAGTADGKCLASFKSAPRQARRRTDDAQGDERAPPSAIGSDGVRQGAICDNPLAQCSVSTTTEDLPLDSSTRKRILKLTSDEIISEHTEPRSASTAALEQAATQVVKADGPSLVCGQQSRGEKLDLPARAVSLGPDLADKIRGRGARSDVGRRRSLERTVCVDLDSGLPSGSVMKQPRLSPLLQSTAASPQQAFVDRSSPRRSQADQIYGMGHYTTSELRAADMGRFGRAGDLPDGNAPGRQVAGAGGQQQLATFKSAPDVSGDGERGPVRSDRLAGEVSSGCEFGGPLGDEYDDEALDMLERHQQHCLDAVPSRARPNLSSYAVPLCTTVKRPPLQAPPPRRQCSSCPNSLRRKRRPPSADSHQEVECFGDPSMAYLPPAHIDNCCSYKHFRQQQASCLSHRPDLGAVHACCETMAHPAIEYAACAYAAGHHDAWRGEPADQPHLDQAHWRHHRAIHHHHQLPTRTATRDDLLRDMARDGPRPGSSSGSHEQPRQATCGGPANQSSRPLSSQSVRSPMQYGLYESDCDEDVSWPSRVPLGLELCGASDYHVGGHLCQAAPSVVRPVRGYDQTMSRACLKSRQRSRSQPPGGAEELEEADARSAQHLTKSMENVEKLIREVQNELRSLKRQPLGAAHIDMTAATARQTARQVSQEEPVDAPGDQSRSATVEMAQEERLNEKQQENGRAQLSYSSATRRAGQFKCAGAIRKAGFLSVKKWILKRRQSIELARKQGWRRYWVCLRGTALLFHSVLEAKPREQPTDVRPEQKQVDLASWIRANCSSQLGAMTGLMRSESRQADLAQEAFLEGMSECYIEEEPRHLIIIDGAIAQPIPEHPRRDFVFCLSTTFGDAYLFQASCQLEADNWISAIHNACAASIARDLIRDEAVKLFETKVRHFELEAEKKLFLRHRLESRLTSMSAMCCTGAREDLAAASQRSEAPAARATHGDNKRTMRSLLGQLSQQLMALDSYIEQLHCEIYQLRCYSSSCSAQNAFYTNNALTGQTGPAGQSQDLPHPKSLLMHVSKPTKLLLIKLGVFTVSSFHAFIHARQESAKSILEAIQQQSSCPESPVVELRIRSHSISETLMSRPENVRLASETENLIEMANLKTVTIVLARPLFNKIKASEGRREQVEMDASDDLCSIQDCGQSVRLNVKLNPSSTSSSIIGRVLSILRPASSELDFLNYYLRLAVQATPNGAARHGEDPSKTCDYFVVKRKERLENLSNYSHIELLEKILFRVQLARSRIDEEDTTAPFGISVEGQLLTSGSESLLNVYCSYIEWGSAADKAGLQDEDEFLMVNGVPVADLDLMFVECILQDAAKLRAVVRSSRGECPPQGKLLDQTNWRSLDGDGTADGETQEPLSQWPARAGNNQSVVSQVISDEYITSLVCPPPPSKSGAFLRTNTNLLRQKSDLGLDRPQAAGFDDTQGNAATTFPKSKSQHRIDASALEDNSIDDVGSKTPTSVNANNVISSAELAQQLKQKTERITRLLGKQDVNSEPEAKIVNNNQVERLKKSILELVETEYAYIRHLETINDHYMCPLRETSFLNIFDLGLFSQTVMSLLDFQRKFFAMLIKDISEKMIAGTIGFNDDLERLNWIVQKTDSYEDVKKLNPVIGSMASIFSAEAERFKVYASYCVAYSRLQRILHPKNATSATPTIISIPNSLNTFVSATGLNNIGSLANLHRDLKLFSLIGGSPAGSEDRSTQLKQLAEFLGNLDSSSSSASFSLQRSSASEHQSKPDSANTQHCKNSSSDCSNELNDRPASSNAYQRSTHHQNFESYLIKPIQRLVKYPMLLNSIALAGQSLADESHLSHLHAAIKQLEIVINHVNESQRVHDEYGIIFEHIERQFFELQALDSCKNTVTNLFGPHQPPITLNITGLLYSGQVHWLNVDNFTSKTKKTAHLVTVLFVFESCVVLICKEQIRVSGKKRLPLRSSDSLTGQASQQQSGGITSKVLQWSSGGSSEQVSELVRYQTLIPVSEVQVRSATSGTASEKKTDKLREEGRSFDWELFQCSSSNSNSNLLIKTSTASGKQQQPQQQQQQSLQQHRHSNTGKIYLLSSPSNEERSVFLRKIRFTIRESVRNMSLPTAGSTKSSLSYRSLAFKKLSTSSASSATSNTNINTSGSLSPPESSGGPDLLTQDQSTTVKCELYTTKKVLETSVEVRT